MKENTDEYTHLVWLWCLDLAWLGLQVVETLSRVHSFHRYPFYFFGVDSSVDEAVEYYW